MSNMKYTTRLEASSHVSGVQLFTIISYETDFKGVLTISAYSLETDADNRYELPNGS